MSHRWGALAAMIVCACQKANPAFDPRLPIDAAVDQAAAVDSPPAADLAPGPDLAPPGPDLTAPGPDLAAPPDAPSTRTVSVAPGGTTMGYGSTTAGTRYQDDCASDEAVVGYAGYKRPYAGGAVEEYLVSLQVICGRLELPSGSSALRITTMRTLPLREITAQTAWQVICPPDQVIVGYAALLGDEEDFDHLQFRCAPMSVVDSPPGAVSPGAVTTLAWTGRMTIGREVSTSCPAGQVGRGHVVRAGSYLDAFQMSCGIATASP